MAAVESDLPPSIPHPIADATDTPHASNVVQSIHEPEFVDSQPLVIDTNDTSLPEVTKLAFDTSASALLDASLGSMEPAYISENANNASVAGETAMVTVGPDDVEAHDISNSNATLDKNVIEDSLMENDAKAEDAHVSSTEQVPTSLLSSNLGTSTTDTTTDAVPLSEAMILGASEDERLSGSAAFKGDPIPSNKVAREPVIGQDVTEAVSNKPDEELEKKTAIVAGTDLAEKVDAIENHLIVEDAETKVDDKEAPAAEITSIVESKPLEGETTMSTEQTPLEVEATDYSTAEDVLDPDKKESKVEVDQADVSGVVVEDRVTEPPAGGIHEEATKVEHKEANERKGSSVEPAVGGQSEELEPTKTPVEATTASSLVNETPISAVPVAETPDLGISEVEISAEPEETLSVPVVSNEEKTSEETIVLHPDAGIINLSQAVEEPAPLLQQETVESIATANEVSIAETEVANPNIEERAADSATGPPAVRSQSHLAAEVEADFLAEKPAVPGREDNALEVTNIGAEPVFDGVGGTIPGSTQYEFTAQEASMEMSNKPVVADAIQQVSEEQPPVEEIATPIEAEVAEQPAVESAADPVLETPVIQESPSLKAPVPSEVIAKSIVDQVEEGHVTEETTEAQKTDAEHEVIAEEVVEEPPVADHQPPADLAPNQDGGEQLLEKVEEMVEEQVSPVVEPSQDEKDGVAAEAPTTTTVEEDLVVRTSIEANEATVEETPTGPEKVSVKDISAEVETAVVDEAPAEVRGTAMREISVEGEKPVVEEVTAEAETALVGVTPADARESVLPEPAIEEERSTEAPTTIEGGQPQVNGAVVDVKDEVIENVTEAVSEQTIVDSVPVGKDTANVLREPVDIPESEKDVVETPAGSADEKEEASVKQHVEQIGEPEQVQHIPSVINKKDTMLETAEVSTSIETVPVAKAELVVEEVDGIPVSENLATSILAAETSGLGQVEASVVGGNQDLEEPRSGTVEVSRSAPYDQQSEVVISHEIGDTGAVNSKDSTQETVLFMDDSLVSEVSEADTTTETIIVPEPITQKKSDSAGPTTEEIGASHVEEAPILVIDDIKEDKLQLDIPRVATPVERPKSPWTPSFQVTTIGQGVSLPPEDILVHSLDGSEETTAIPSEEASAVVNDSLDEVPVNVSPNEIERDELKSTSSLWTPSYSVHSQGSPNPPHASLEPENPTTADEEVEADTDVLTVEHPLVHEDAVPPVAEKPEPELVKSQPIEAEQAEKVVVETMNVTEEPIAVLKNATPESPAIQEPLDEVFVEEVSIPVPTIQEQDTFVIPTSKEEESPKVNQPALETALTESQVLEQHNAEDDSSLTPPGQQSGSASPSWIPSYSVSRQGSPLPRPVALPSADISEIRLAPPQTDPLVQEDAQKDALKDAASIMTAPTVAVDGAEVVEVEKAQLAEDRPATPWTPSYSVTVQGADVLQETTIESLSPPPQPEKAKGPEVRQRRSLSEEMESGAFSPTALIGAGFAGGAAVYAASAALRNSNDGRTSADVAEPQMQQEKYFPTVEIPDGNKHHTAPRPEGNEASHTTGTRSPETSPISSRKRLESTTSSRLFPGGWFSTSSTIPDERTSLEVAQGEFSGAKQGGLAEGSLQSPTSPTVEPITPVREQSSTDKRKWCTIM